MQFWADALAEQWRAGRDVFAYFNNDPEAMAVINAQELRSLMWARLQEETLGNLVS
jgi:uncharacterized protein YecE (DUF72 family)